MQLYQSAYTPIRKPLFAAATSKSPLKLGDWPVEVHDIPEAEVRAALQDVATGSFGQNYLPNLPKSLSLKIYRHPEGQKPLVLTVQGLPKDITPYVRIRTPKAASVLVALRTTLALLNRLRVEGKLADIS